MEQPLLSEVCGTEVRVRCAPHQLLAVVVMGSGLRSEVHSKLCGGAWFYSLSIWKMGRLTFEFEASPVQQVPGQPGQHSEAITQTTIKQQSVFSVSYIILWVTRGPHIR